MGKRSVPRRRPGEIWLLLAIHDTRDSCRRTGKYPCCTDRKEYPCACHDGARGVRPGRQPRLPECFTTEGDTRVLTSKDRIHGLQGLAGTGKTTTLESIREGAERDYKVEGFAPTLRAAGQLREARIEANTLQSFLARKQDETPASRDCAC